MYGPALKDVEEGQRNTGDIDDDQSGNGCPFENLLVLGECKVEEANGCLGSHQSRVLNRSARGIPASNMAETCIEDQEGILRLPQWRMMVFPDVRFVSPQAHRCPVADGEGESKGNELEQFINPGNFEREIGGVGLNSPMPQS